MGETWNVTLRLVNAKDNTYNLAPMSSLGFSAMGCACSITKYADTGYTYGPAQEHAWDDPPPEGMGGMGSWFGKYYWYTVTYTWPGTMGGTSIPLYVWLGDDWQVAVVGPPLASGAVVVTTDTVDINVSISVAGLFLKGELGDLSGDNRNILDYTDEYVDYKWYADGSTTSTITISGAVSGTNSGNWGTWGAGDEVDILVGETFGCAYTYVANWGRDGARHGSICNIQWGDGVISTSGIDKLYSTSGSTWSRTVPGGADYWRFYSGNEISIVRYGASTTSDASWTGWSKAPYIVEYAASAESAAYFDEEGAALGLRFMSNYIVWDDEDTYHIEPVENGTTVVQSVSSWNENYPAEWQKLTSRNIIVYENEADRVSFGDDLGETDTPMAQSDAQCRIPIPRLDATTLELDSYGGLFWANFGAIAHQDNLSVNVPVSGSARPSLWASSTVAVDGTNNDLWTLGVSSTGNTVQRDFVTWVYDRLNRLAGGYTAGNEYNDAWYWSYKANLDISLTGDDPDWHTAKPIEDRTNWSNYRYFAINLTSELAGTVTFRINYKVPAISDPFYTCAGYRWDQFEVAYSSYSLSWTFDIIAGSSLIVIDKFLNNESINPIGDYRLQIVDSIRFTLPNNEDTENAYDITLNDITLIQDPGDGYHTEPSTHFEYRSKRNWQWYGNNSVGIHAYIDGTPAMEIDYGQSINKEYGIPSTQRIEHCPTTADQSYRLDSARILSAAIMDFDYNEGFEASSNYNTVKDSSGNKDADDNYLVGNFYFWDLHPNYTQRAAATINVSGCKQVGQYRIPAGAKVTIWLMAHPRGRVHGLLFDTAREQVLRSNAANLKVYGNSGSGWSQVQSGLGTDIHGRFISDEFRETGWAYKVGASPQQTVYTREYSWFINGIKGAHYDPFIITDKLGQILRSIEGNGLIEVTRAGIDMEFDTASFPFGETSGYERPSICELPTGRLITAATKDGALHLAASDDHGETWTVLS